MNPITSLDNRSFYKGKRVLLTGHTGFKGAWLTCIMYKLGAQTLGYALAPELGSLFVNIKGTQLINSIEGDIRDFKKLKTSLCNFNPEIVFHFAALLPIQACFEYPRNSFETDVMGTVNLFEAIRECYNVKSVVIVTSDKVYENKGDGAVYKVGDQLGGTDPYSASKTCEELIAEAYKHSYLQTPERIVGVATTRASNVLAGGDHIKTRLIPSILNAIAKDMPVEVRNPHQTRPWQSMLDALNGYLTVARLLYSEPVKYSKAWNIGPTLDGIRDVAWVIDKIRQYYAGVDFIKKTFKGPVESETLGLDISESIRDLAWKPEMTCDETIFQVVDFFKKQRLGIPDRTICFEQIDNFFNIKEISDDSI